MALIAPRVTAGLPAEDAQNLRYALDGSHDITVFVDGTVHRLPSANCWAASAAAWPCRSAASR